MNTKTAAPTCYGQTIGRNFCQEWYETATRDAGKRAKELRAAGYTVSVSSMGTQVTNVGRVKMTLVSVRGDDMSAIPAVKIVHI